MSLATAIQHGGIDSEVGSPATMVSSRWKSFKKQLIALEFM